MSLWKIEIIILNYIYYYYYTSVLMKISIKIEIIILQYLSQEWCSPWYWWWFLVGTQHRGYNLKILFPHTPLFTLATILSGIAGRGCLPFPFDNFSQISKSFPVWLSSKINRLLNETLGSESIAVTLYRQLSVSYCLLMGTCHRAMYRIKPL